MSKIGTMALRAQRLGFDLLAHRLIDNAIARAPLGDVLDELSRELRSIHHNDPRFIKAIEIQVLIDEYRKES